MYEIFIAGGISFLITFLFMPFWMKKARSIGLTGKDMNKYDKPEIPETGGIVVFFGFIAGILFLTLLYYLWNDMNTVYYYLASMISLSIITIIAYMDDISGWKKGFARWKKPILTSIAVLPLIPFIINRTDITLIGIPIELPYLFYPLVLVPIGFIGATNAVNLLGGFNGLEAGLGLIACATLMWFSYGTIFFPLMFVAFFSILAFFWYNRYPSRVFPGDTFTYFLGGLLAIFAVLGRYQTATILIMMPYLLEGIIKSREIPYILKHRKTFRPECFGRVLKDNSLQEPYKEVWSLTHIFIKLIRKLKGKCYENDVTTTILTIYATWCLFIIAVYIWVLV